MTIPVEILKFLRLLLLVLFCCHGVLVRRRSLWYYSPAIVGNIRSGRQLENPLDEGKICEYSSLLFIVRFDLFKHGFLKFFWIYILVVTGLDAI